MKRTIIGCTVCLTLALLPACSGLSADTEAVGAGQQAVEAQVPTPEDSTEQHVESSPDMTAATSAGKTVSAYAGKTASDEFVSVKTFGAVGDGETDDTEAIQEAVSSDEIIYFPAGSYKISNPIMISQKKIWSLYAQDASFVYSGNDYAFKVNEAQHCHIEIGEIISENGGGIEFFSEDIEKWNQYVSLTFDYIDCATDCIHIQVTGGWCNENQVYGGRFAGGNNGVHVEYLGADVLNGWKFYNCGIEGVDNGFLFDAGRGYITGMSIVNARYAESFNTILKTSGIVQDCIWIGANVVRPDMVMCSTNTNRFEIIAPIGETGHRGCIVEGTLMVEKTEYERAE